MTPEEHRMLREMLGAFTLGHLSAEEEASIQAHLDGCPDCRREFTEIEPLARALKFVDPNHVSDLATPAPQLGQRIFAAVAVEREQQDRRARHRLVLVAAAVVFAILAVGGVGLAIGENLAEAPAATAPAVPIEPVAVSSTLDGTRASAGIVAHTWGIEIKLQAVGLRSGSSYAVVVTTEDGTRRSAGAFVGTGEQVMNCNLNTDVLRPDATGFKVLDETGQTVLTADM
ncbi:MAG: zf-HC2 domain-containing protein [Nocardioidaceae bacterium]|nr:zf-HC2 domain-containing protein [Nocardioidaceae bacterium]